MVYFENYFINFAQINFNTMTKEKKCLICQTTDDQLPLLNFDFKGQQYHICSQHIPVLIHQAGTLSSLLPGLEEVDETETFN
ncbi:MAG TPA: hypothetical protein DCQ58_09240 [Saprospirales bacterium]|nr:hypothetical protein [Saprospirales bacterium]